MAALTIRPLNADDYDEILVKWWHDWRWTAPSKDMLPDNGKGGLIVYDGIEPVCAGFLYTTNSKMAWVEWVISDFYYKDRDQRKMAIGMLVETLTGVAGDLGNKCCYALLKNKGLIETYKLLGYVDGDMYNKEMIKIL